MLKTYFLCPKMRERKQKRQKCRKTVCFRLAANKVGPLSIFGGLFSYQQAINLSLLLSASFSSTFQFSPLFCSSQVEQIGPFNDRESVDSEGGRGRQNVGSNFMIAFVLPKHTGHAAASRVSGQQINAVTYFRRCAAKVITNSLIRIAQQ